MLHIIQAAGTATISVNRSGHYNTTTTDNKLTEAVALKQLPQLIALTVAVTLGRPSWLSFNHGVCSHSNRRN